MSIMLDYIIVYCSPAMHFDPGVNNQILFDWPIEKYASRRC